MATVAVKAVKTQRSSFVQRMPRLYASFRCHSGEMIIARELCGPWTPTAVFKRTRHTICRPANRETCFKRVYNAVLFGGGKTKIVDGMQVKEKYSYDTKTKKDRQKVSV